VSAAAALLDRARAADVTITATSGGTLDLFGPPDAIAALTPELRAHKSELLAHLRAANEAPARALSASEESAIRRWLDRIGEQDCELIAETLNRCAANPDALAYYLGRAANEPDDSQADLDELVKERAAILEHDGGLSRDDAERIAKGAASAYYDHLMRQRESGCGCRTNIGALVTRSCPEGQRLRDVYHRAVEETP
jgi:hypothetical protein